MNGRHRSSHRSSSEQESERESFVVEDSEDDSLVLSRNNGSGYRVDKNGIIEESDDEELPSSRSSNTPNLLNVESEFSDEDRLTPVIKKAIRRSIYRLTHEDEENGQDEKIDDGSDSDEPVISDKEYEDAVDDDEDSNIQYLSEEQQSDDSTDEAAISRNHRQPNKIASDSESEESVREKIRRSVRGAIQDDDDSSGDESSYEISEQSVTEVKVPTAKPIVISDESDGDDVDTSGNQDADHSIDVAERTIAMSMAKEELGTGTSIDPMAAQKRVLLICKRQQLETKLAKTKKLYTVGAINALPDGGEKLRLSIAATEKELTSVIEELKEIKMTADVASPPQAQNEVKSLFKQESSEIDPVYMKPTTEGIKRELGKKAQETLYREQSLTVERLQDLHGSLVARPAEDERAKDPKGLKITLMPHQQHALAWLLWRESQKPRGGVLADDMGLGKTLTMISLVMASLAKSESGESEDEDEWRSSERTQRHLGGTLVIAPASLVAQWESEVNNRCKRGTLTVELYHGNNRENVPKRLAKNNIVITTYNIVSREFKMNGILFKIHWRRVILDEAHVIRNHKSQTCESVCGLHANTRWALTGTPIHNKEMDLYAILKFLQCSPFDDVRVWKRWVDNKNAAGHERLATVMKTLMLRRTKQELQAKGSLVALPDKSIEVIDVTLDPEERLVYDKVMVYSRTLFAQFLAQRAEKAHMYELGAGKYDKPSWEVTHKNTQFTKAQTKLLAMHADVKSHEILVLLLRLRQVCCHPSLINSMLDQEEIAQDGGEDTGTDFDLMAKMNKMNIKGEPEEDENEGDVGVDERVTEHLLTSDNPVFNMKRRSSKMRMVLEKIEEILENGDKLIVVSQWVGVLDIIAEELASVEGASYRMFTGKVAVKDRQGIMDDFNSERHPNILLLSLTAGGVGLNLVGANHLLLIDIHWNPQLESQAQDRIYRFGQKKDVFIYKYICTDTIEERIKALQEKKLELATAVLSGGGKVVGSKLSLDDIKSLFGL